MSKEDAPEIRIIYNINKKDEANEEDEEYEVYEGDKENIRIFGDIFVENNKNKCKMIIDNKELDITRKYNIENYKNNKLEIKLKGINNVTDMSGMFSGCSSLSSLPDISKWNTINVTNMKSMFRGCSSLPDISKWNTNNANNMNWIFSGCSSLTSLPNISK